METRANYVLVGGFVLLLLAGLAVFVLWFAKLQFDTEFARYDIRHSGTVTGLNEGGPVRYSGVRVGEVIQIQLDHDDPSQVMVTIEVDSTTPVRQDTRASLEIEGLTGARYVLLKGGSPGSQPIVPEPGEKYAVIPSEASGLQQVLEGAPELLAGATILMARATAYLSDENRVNLEATLANLNTLTGVLAGRGDDIGLLIDQTGETMASLNRTAATFELLIGQVREDSRRLADRADDAVTAVEQLTASLDQSVGSSAEALKDLLDEMRGSAGAFTKMTSEIQAMVAENREPLRDFAAGGLYELNTLLIEARALLTGLNRVTTEVERDPARFLFGDQQSGYEAGKP
jgi:phospholipid/cholesterol/gamma-HCH transport system substrate-binding protein